MFYQTGHGHIITRYFNRIEYIILWVGVTTFKIDQYPLFSISIVRDRECQLPPALLMYCPPVVVFVILQRTEGLSPLAAQGAFFKPRYIKIETFHSGRLNLPSILFRQLDNSLLWSSKEAAELILKDSSHRNHWVCSSPVVVVLVAPHRAETQWFHRHNTRRPIHHYPITDVRRRRRAGRGLGIGPELALFIQSLARQHCFEEYAKSILSVSKIDPMTPFLTVLFLCLGSWRWSRLGFLSVFQNPNRGVINLAPRHVSCNIVDISQNLTPVPSRFFQDPWISRRSESEPIAVLAEQRALLVRSVCEPNRPRTLQQEETSWVDHRAVLPNVVPEDREAEMEQSQANGLEKQLQCRLLPPAKVQRQRLLVRVPLQVL